MLVGQTVTMSVTPALVYTVSGRRAHVVLSHVSGGGGASILIAGEASPADWFTMPAGDTPVHLQVEAGEEIWAKCDQFAPMLAIIVPGD